jgi:hypothetical protein
MMLSTMSLSRTHHPVLRAAPSAVVYPEVADEGEKDGQSVRRERAGKKNKKLAAHIVVPLVVPDIDIDIGTKHIVNKSI